jgi:anion-transporting  ArsA/GET3 family ATPase
MDVAAFCAESRLLVVAGKGGTGKTTVSAALARMAAEAGLRVLLVELEGKPAITAAFGEAGPLRYDESELFSTGERGGRVRGRWVTPDDALLEYLKDHGFHRISKRLISSGVIDVVATAIPGIRDVLVLGKVKQLERSDTDDLVIVDAPATGHAVTFLTSPAGLLDAARSGPIRTQAAEVLEMLADPTRCRVLLVTLPEELPVRETIDAAYRLEDEAGVQLGPVIVNGCVPQELQLEMSAALAAEASGVTLPEPTLNALEDARQFTLHRRELQQGQIEALGRELPLPQIQLPAVASATIGPGELAELADALRLGIAAIRPEMADDG